MIGILEQLRAFLAWRRRTVVYRFVVPAGTGFTWSSVYGSSAFRVPLAEQARVIEVYIP